jgi:Ca-activated chloride channel homolog
MNRTILSAPTTRQAFGLIAWLEQTRVILPLKGVECRFTVCGELLGVEIDQIFHQNNPQALDCLYSFPLPGDAAVYRCELHVNGRVIRAKVEEVEQARRLFQEKKAAGHRAALVEQERPNLFTLSLGNLQPNDVVIVRLAYFQTLTRLGDWTSFNIPFCPGVRYIPGAPLLRAPSGRGVVDDTDQVPDASRITPPRMDRLHPDAAYLSVEGTVEHPRGEVRDISSSSHPVLVRDGEKASTITLADNTAVPDSDFALRWTEVKPQELAPMGWVLREEGQSYALLRLVAPEVAATEDTEGQDVYFLVDRSGSMEGLKWQKAVQSFHEYLKVLGPKDRVWATFFESGFIDLAEKPLPATALLADRGVATLEKLGATGGTELLPALNHVLDKVTEHSASRRASLLLITDGQVGNEAEIIRVMKHHPQLRMHTFGIDTAVNDAFLKQLAAQQRGTCCLVMPQDDIVGTIARLGDRLRRPVLTQLNLDGGWEWAGAPARDLHAGEVLSVPVRSSGISEAVTVMGRAADGQPRTYEFKLEQTNLPALRLLWARRQIEHHLSQREREAALTLAKAHNLVCDGAAFIAWDEAEKVAVSAPERLLYQPAMQPQLMRSFHLGGTAHTQPLPAMDHFREEAHFKRGRTRWAIKQEDFVDLTRESLPQGVLGSVQSESSQAKETSDYLPLLQQLSTRLRRFLPDDLRQRILDSLWNWVSDDLTQTEARTTALTELTDRLQAARNDRTTVLALLREWVEKTLNDPEHVRQTLLLLIEQAEKAAGIKGPP